MSLQSPEPFTKISLNYKSVSTTNDESDKDKDSTNPSTYALPFPLIPMPSSYDSTVLLSMRTFSHFPPSFDPCPAHFEVNQSQPMNSDSQNFGSPGKDDKEQIFHRIKL